MLTALRRVVRLRSVVDDPNDQFVIGKLEPHARVLVLIADACIDPHRRMGAIGGDATYLKMPVLRKPMLAAPATSGIPY
ncbi:hypothetical protein [Micromonospora sp. NPDC000668]|uniref:hypothetical protein n=1 Tax=Micromonospora sp. NPDC000668 TaxID=3364219 RepID=UPI0036CF6EAA